MDSRVRAQIHRKERASLQVPDDVGKRMTELKHTYGAHEVDWRRIG